MEGSDVLINCIIESSPDPVVTWYKDGVQVNETNRIDIQIEDSDRQDVRHYELAIRNVIDSDSAVYVCSANNTIIPSSVSATITLTVTNIGKSHDHHVIHVHILLTLYPGYLMYMYIHIYKWLLISHMTIM